MTLWLYWDILPQRTEAAIYASHVTMRRPSIAGPIWQIFERGCFSYHHFQASRHYHGFRLAFLSEMAAWSATVSCSGLIPIFSIGFSPCWTRPLGWSWTSPSSAIYQLPSATNSTGFHSGEGSTLSRWVLIEWLHLCCRSHNRWPSGMGHHRWPYCDRSRHRWPFGMGRHRWPYCDRSSHTSGLGE